MATVYKRLGATVVTASTPADLYTVPASTSAIISSIVICNIGATERTFRVSIRDGAQANEDYIYYDLTISGNDTFICTAGFTMATTNVITVYASHADVVFSVFGSELT